MARITASFVRLFAGMEITDTSDEATTRVFRSPPRGLQGALCALIVLLGTACGAGAPTDEVLTGTRPEVTAAPNNATTTSTSTTTQLAGDSAGGGVPTSTSRPTSVPPTVAPSTTLQPTTTRPTTTTRANPGPPPSGPYNPDFVDGPGPRKWYPRLQSLDPAACAALVTEITQTLSFPTAPYLDMGLPMHVARLAFRGVARACSNDVTGARADLACAAKHRATTNARPDERLRFDVRDPGSAALLDWALKAYGPVTAPCADG